MNKILNRLGLLSVLCALLGCDKDMSGIGIAQPTHLIDGIPSILSFIEFKTRYLTNNIPWGVELDFRRPARPPRCPPCHIFAIVITNYHHYDFVGDLRVEFFNDRLSETWFYPSLPNNKNYTIFLKSLSNLKFDSEDKAELPPFTKVRISRNHFVKWVDTRLSDAKGNWLRDCY